MEQIDRHGAGELRLLLGDDHVVTRRGIKCAVEPHGVRVVGEASTAAEAVALCVRERPNLCLLATAIPGDGIDAVRELKRRLPEVKVVMLGDGGRREELFDALRAGADGYLFKGMSPARLPHVIRGVANGEAALPRELTAELIHEFRKRSNARRLELSPGRTVQLTAREFEVLDCLRRREGTAEVAAQLGIADATVRRHVASIMHKVGASSRRGMLEMLDRGSRA